MAIASCLVLISVVAVVLVASVKISIIISVISITIVIVAILTNTTRSIVVSVGWMKPGPSVLNVRGFLGGTFRRSSTSCRVLDPGVQEHVERAGVISNGRFRV